MMTSRQRIMTALRGEHPDRVPYALWMHSTVHEKSVPRFVEYTLSFFRRFRPDLIKVMYDDFYDISVIYQFLQSPDLWITLEDYDPHIGAFGRQLEALKIIRDQTPPDVPVVQTIFSPFHIGHRLAYRRILQDWTQDRSAVMNGLEIIARNHAAFARCCVEEAGIDGFFFGAFGCEEAWMTPDIYSKNVMPSDLLILDELRNAEILILHIHGEQTIFFDLLAEYPCDAISWADRAAGPSLAQARDKTEKCLMGGVDHLAARKAPAHQILEQAKEALTITAGQGFILAPGCTFFPETPPENMDALGIAVRR